MIFSEGTDINGSDLTNSLSDFFGEKTSITGGIAGDGVRFQKTLVGWNDYLSPNLVVVVGLYGEDLKIGFGRKRRF